jgi:hypothetical protein
MTQWELKGCAVCRRAWETGQPPPEISVSRPTHTSLHKCEVCGSYWEQYERYADIILEDEARRRYPKAFK